MATLIDKTPDKIEQLPNEKYLFYFTDGKDLNALPVRAEYTVVSIPTMYTIRGQVIHYRVIMKPGTSRAVQTVNQRELTVAEIAYFRNLIRADRIGGLPSTAISS